MIRVFLPIYRCGLYLFTLTSEGEPAEKKDDERPP
jgi:hypothetical protein